jgi:hypothetical protein
MKLNTRPLKFPKRKVILKELESEKCDAIMTSLSNTKIVEVDGKIFNINGQIARL